MVEPRQRRGEGAIRAGEHSELLALRAAVHALRQILHRGRRSVDTEPPDADRGRLAHHQQPALPRSDPLATSLQHSLAAGGPGESRPDLGQLRRVCAGIYHGAQGEQKEHDRRQVRPGRGRRQASHRFLGLRTDRSQRASGRTGEGRSEMDGRPGRRNRQGWAMAKYRRLHHLG